MIQFKALTTMPVAAAVGFIPQFFSEDNPASAKEQLNKAYAHGGGWCPFEGFTFNAEKRELIYPNDPPTRALAEGKLRDETIIVFEHAWVVILQTDGSWEVARID